MYELEHVYNYSESIPKQRKDMDVAKRRKFNL